MSRARTTRFFGMCGIGLVVCAVSGGCQTAPGDGTRVAQDHTEFAHLWTAYTRCLASSDLESARRQADLLHRAAFREEDRRTFLPSTLDRYVEKPPIRLAADPRDLATACRTHVDRIKDSQASR